MTTLKELIKAMFSKNEAKLNEIYVISNAEKAESGWSFGQAQWDLSKNPTIYEYPDTNTGEIEKYTAHKMLSDILSSATSGGNRILSDKDIEDIMVQVVKTDGNISTYESRINLALQSDYGKQKIDTSYDSYLGYKITRLNTLYSELEGAGRTDVADYIRGNTLMQMMLVDYDNQFGIDGVDGNQNDPVKAKLLQYLKNGQTTFKRGNKVNVDGSFDVVDYLKFLFETKYAYNFKDKGANDLLRRFSNIINIAKENGILLGDERKIVNDLLGLNALKLGARELLDKIRDLFTTAKTTASPIILDLDGDGVETTGVADGAYFDHDGNGFAEQTGWASSDDGILKDRQMANGEGLKIFVGNRP